MKVTAAADGAFTALVFRRAPGNRHSELVAAVLAFVVPGAAFKDVLAGSKGSPGRGFDNVGAVTGRAVYFNIRRRNSGYRNIEQVPAFLT